jgi:hypothetical protein
LPSAVAESRMRSCCPDKSMGAAIRLPPMASLTISCCIRKRWVSEGFTCSRYSDSSPAAGADCAACCFSYGICTDRLMDEQSAANVRKMPTLYPFSAVALQHAVSLLRKPYLAASPCPLCPDIRRSLTLGYVGQTDFNVLIPGRHATTPPIYCITPIKRWLQSHICPSTLH